LQQPLDLEDLLQLAQAEGFALNEQDVIEAQLREEAHLSDAELQRRAGEEARRLRHFIPG
jgi:predicted ribosomally synthesized peptide with nif11-like leader